MKSPCPTCGNKRHVKTEKGWEPCECLKALRYSRRLAEAGIPKYMESFTWRGWASRHKAGAKFSYLVAELPGKLIAKACRTYALPGLPTLPSRGSDALSEVNLFLTNNSGSPRHRPIALPGHP